ncbi:MAG: hypothetical protein HOU01_24045 [Streptomycetaceae bacterium]|nr:hypothetical protein [Streptomycetaceae bacterium]
MAEGEPVRGLIPVDPQVLKTTIAAAAAQQEMAKILPGLQPLADGMTKAADRLTRAGIEADTGAAAVRAGMRAKAHEKGL